MVELSNRMLGYLAKLATALIMLLVSGPALAEPPIFFISPRSGLGVPEPDVERAISPSVISTWSQLYPHVASYDIASQWFRFNPTLVQSVVNDAAAAGLAIGTGAGVLANAACDGKVEGFNFPDLVIAAQMIQKVGGRISYVGYDEPWFYGTVFPSACREQASTAAENVAAAIGALRAVFPGVVLIEAEPLPAPTYDGNWLDDLVEWERLLRDRGVAPAYFEADIQWSYASWPAQLSQLAFALADIGIQTGFLVNGLGGADCGAWQAEAEYRALLYPNAPLYDIASWDVCPAQIEPGTVPSLAGIAEAVRDEIGPTGPGRNRANGAGVR